MQWSGIGFTHTSADATSSSSSKAGPKITLQPFSVVTRLGQAAVLIQLPGANFAAAAAVQDDAHAGCTLGHLRQTLTHGGARGEGVDLYSHQQKLPLNAGTSEVFRQKKSQQITLIERLTYFPRPSIKNVTSEMFTFHISFQKYRSTYQAEASKEGKDNCKHQHR